MKKQLSAYQAVKNDSHMDNLSVNILSSIKRYINAGINYSEYDRQTRQKSLAKASNLCLTTLEHLNFEADPKLGANLAQVLNISHKFCAEEIKTEKSKDFSDIFKALDSLIDISK